MSKNMMICLLSAILLFPGCASLGKRAVSRDMAVRNPANEELAKEGERMKSETAEELVNMLKAADFQDKALAVEALSSACRNSRETTRLMVKSFCDQDPQIRYYLEEAVVKSGSTAIPELIEGLKNDNKYIRLHCAYGLKSAGTNSKEAISPLILALSDQDNEVCSASRDTLAAIGGNDQEALLAGLKTANPSIRFRVAFVLGRVGLPDERTIDSLVGLLSDPDQMIRASAVDSLVKLASTGEASTALFLKKLGSMTNDGSIVQVLEALGRSGSKSPAVTKALFAYMKHADASLRAAAAYSIASLNPDLPETVAGLIAALQDEDSEVRVAAAKGLGSVTVSRKEAVTALIKSFADKFIFARTAAQVSVGKLAFDEKEFTVASLLAGMKDTDRNIRAGSVIALGSLGTAAASNTAALALMLNDSEKDVRKAAVSALGTAGLSAKEAVGGLIQRLKDTDGDVRNEAAAALEKAGYQSREAVTKIAEALSDPDPEFRVSVEKILFKIGPAAISALVQKLDDKNVLVRQSTVRVLGRIGRTVPTINDAVRKMNTLLKDPEKSVRLAVTIALGEIAMNNKETTMLLIESMRDKDRDIRYYSVLALGKIGPDAKEAAPFLVAALKEDDNKIRSAAKDALVLIGNEAVDSLAEALKESDLLIRSAAIDALEKINSQKARDILKAYKSK